MSPLIGLIAASGIQTHYQKGREDEHKRNTMKCFIHNYHCVDGKTNSTMHENSRLPPEGVINSNRL
jgi:hypothetical protein